MDQSDVRMGWAPALLCIEDEPAKTPKVVALKPHPKQKEFDAFAKGNHIGGCVAGDSLYGVIENFSVVKSPLLGEKSGLSMLQQEQNRIGRRMLESMGIYRGANDNKTATEVQLRTASAELRIQDALVNKARVQETMQRHVEYATMPRRNGKTFTPRMLEQTSGGQNGWFTGAPPCVGWWQASKSKREDHARYWDGRFWSPSVSMRPVAVAPKLSFAVDTPSNSARVKWRPVTPHWIPGKTLVLDQGRPVLYVPTYEGPLAQLRMYESFNSSSIGGYLGALTKQKVYNAQKRVEAMMHSEPDCGWMKIRPTPAPELAELNAALSRLSGAAQSSSCEKQQASDWPRWIVGDWDKKWTG